MTSGKHGKGNVEKSKKVRRDSVEGGRWQTGSGPPASFLGEAPRGAVCVV